MRCEDGIDPACREIEVMLLGGLVFADGDRVLEVFLEELRVDGRALRSDRLALEQRLPGVDYFLRRVRILVEKGALVSARELCQWRILHHRETVHAGSVG